MRLQWRRWPVLRRRGKRSAELPEGWTVLEKHGISAQKHDVEDVERSDGRDAGHGVGCRLRATDIAKQQLGLSELLLKILGV